MNAEIQAEVKKILDYAKGKSIIFHKEVKPIEDHFLGLLRVDGHLKVGTWAHIEWEGVMEHGVIPVSWCKPDELKDMKDWEEGWLQIDIVPMGVGHIDILRVGHF